MFILKGFQEIVNIQVVVVFSGNEPEPDEEKICSREENIFKRILSGLGRSAEFPQGREVFEGIQFKQRILEKINF